MVRKRDSLSPGKRITVQGCQDKGFGKAKGGDCWIDSVHFRFMYESLLESISGNR